ncbi:unnamed protein product [Cuscuta campestris]|uniref:Uncharacterized protein n=1 Tax=Cuscuta campestris TaxID=132261 RepID=A0A484NPK0_9ASTE|nr:unnamed protein product [Cuscuta campestris]
MHTQFQVKMEKSLVVLMVGFFLAISWAAGPQLAGATRTGHPLKGILAVTPDGRGLRGDWCQWQGDSCNWTATGVKLAAKGTARRTRMARAYASEKAALVGSSTAAALTTNATATFPAPASPGAKACSFLLP